MVLHSEHIVIAMRSDLFMIEPCATRVRTINHNSSLPRNLLSQIFSDTSATHSMVAFP